MCLITYKPQGVLLDINSLSLAGQENSDGYGALIHKRGWREPLVIKSLVWSIYKSRIEKYMNKDYTVVLHFRLTTAGPTNEASAHPFKIKNNDWLFHNGTMWQLGNKTKSDSQEFAEKLRTISTSYADIIEVVEALEDSRFVIWTPKSVTIINESSGEWANGCWYSKRGYAKRTIPLFVYGTLKKYESNHYHYLNKAVYAGQAETCDAYPLVVDHLPYLIDLPDAGHKVEGDLFFVNQSELNEIDMLEGHPNFYKRSKIEVWLGQECVSAWVYFIQRPSYLLSKDYVSKYDSGIRYYGGRSYNTTGYSFPDGDDVSNEYATVNDEHYVKYLEEKYDLDPDLYSLDLDEYNVATANLICPFCNANLRPIMGVSVQGNDYVEHYCSECDLSLEECLNV